MTGMPTLGSAMDDGTVQDDITDFLASERDALMGLAYVTLGNRDDAEDAVQETISRLLAKDTSDVRDLGRYARTVLVNECRSWRRRVIRRERYVRTLAQDPGAAGSAATYLLSTTEVMDALGSLSRRQRTAVALRYLLDLDDTDIAEHLDCAPATVRSLISRAMRTLRAEITTANEES
jgi:RNA polymerase sigma factor (sigma-70 family)